MPVIDRRAFVGISAATAAALAWNPLRLLAQAAPSNFTELRRGVGIFLGGRGGTIGWLVREDAAVVVDSQFPQTAGICRKGLEERSPRGLDLLVNTHHHGDHTAGNGVFRDAVAKIVAHRAVPDLQRKQAEQGGSAEGQVYADTLFDTTWKEEFGSETVHAKHYAPAHTAGDAVIRFEKANVVHVGDLVFHRWHPFIDPAAGCTIVGWKDVLQRVHDDLDDETIVIFGHGAPKHGVTGKRADILAMRDYFARALDHVRKGIEKGDAKETVAAAEPAGFEAYESPMDRMSLRVTLERTYEELAAPPPAPEAEAEEPTKGS